MAVNTIDKLQFLSFIIVYVVIVFSIDIKPKYVTKFNGHYYQLD